MTLDQTFSNRIGDDLGEQGHRANRVVVTRNWVLEVIGVSVGIQNSDYRNTELLGFIDSEVLAQWVNNPESARRLGKVADSTE